MTRFGKNEGCPASQALLAYQLGDISVREARELRRHLAACEFCSAEVEFYEHYPQAEDGTRADAGSMPKPLFELAEALLVRKSSRRSFDDLLKEVERNPG